MQIEPNKSIETTKKSFEESFETGTFYHKQTRDQGHLERIMDCLKIDGRMKILDLGTGTGYLAFPIAQKYPEAEVTGLDIVQKALDKNREKAKTDGLKNLQFVNYQGVTFPFADSSFDLVITRYALHHFPEINHTFQEVVRVLKTDGMFFLSDPAPNEDDPDRFVDAYMQMKKDGHIKFYTKKEWEVIGKAAGFQLIDRFETQIRFPRKKQFALEFDSIMERFDRNVTEGYSVEIIGDEIWITERVNNLLFRKMVIE